ncbi:MAG: rRNA maturation RNase YbeY [Prochlorococcus sp. SP3034]|nr:rRNA maturation RNase YbeY [Prochlorococcus sp. SP3034]|tara:strand:- start:3 stop:536 length:534 start_codon:yes stop_codon:yes gene_type:complete
MNLKEDIIVDLVFKCNPSAKKLNYLNIKDDNLIFESIFWEFILSKWIKILIEEKLIIKSHNISKQNQFSLSLNIIDNKEISILNKKWLNKSGATDVISFPIIDNQLINDLIFVELGDLFISLEMAFKQAIEYNKSLKQEMLWLASHGLLHLLGWEHNNDSQLKNMINLQEYLISKLN